MIKVINSFGGDTTETEILCDLVSLLLCESLIDINWFLECIAYNNAVMRLDLRSPALLAYFIYQI